MNDNQHDMTIRLAFASNGTARLYAEDRPSSMVVLEAVIDAEQLMALMGGGGASVLAWFTPVPERVGRKMEHGETRVDAYATTKAEAELAAESWRVQNGWETVEIRRNNQGQWVIVGRRWIEES